ncbi:MAG: hypothetical protein N3A58_01550 [Spirochaetes bacterium]|nr:hypothetical protein [Spirochaetota bacterium]
MELYINDVKVDYKLENEKKLKEFFNSLFDFLDKQDMYVISFVIDDKEYFLSQFEQIQNISISDIKQLKVKALLKHELVSESSENIVKYVSSVINYLKSKNEYKDEEIEKVVEGLKWCLDATNRILQLFKLSDEFFIDSSGKNLKTITNLINDYINNIYSIQLDESYKDDFLQILISYSETIVKVVTYVFIMMKGIDKKLKINQYVTLLEDNNKILEDYIAIIPRLRENFAKNIEKSESLNDLNSNEQKDINYTNETIGLNTITKIVEFSTFYLNLILKSTKEYLNEKDSLYLEVISLVEEFTKDLEKLKKSLINREYEEICDYFENDIQNDLLNIKEFTIKLKEFVKSLDKK